MRAYRTQSPYYFSSNHLIPGGVIVFYSDTLKRYVHPVEGVLLDGHPRVQALSEEESNALESQWHSALARYSGAKRS
ncbi:MAG: hypothetical protein FJ147_07455 [Deltaproteobacteria bacterium]|nr:hypothetical protein [Deltaproteobacteria bacterium]